MSASRILVTGAEGQVGWELVRALQPLGQVLALGRAQLDLGDATAIRARVARLRPTVICNAAAYTQVDAAESDRATAHRINADGPGILGVAAQEVGAWVVHYSTDYVFDGTATRAYREEDPASPINAYGASKLAGEQALAASGSAHLILRTSWVYATRGRNFLRTMLHLAREREVLRVVADQVGTPTWARWLAEATAQMVGSLERDARGGEAACRARGGLFHLVGAGETTWHGFAEAIFARDPERAKHRLRRLEAIATSAYPTPAARPARSVLDASRVEALFGIHRVPWEDQLSLALGDGALDTRGGPSARP